MSLTLRRLVVFSTVVKSIAEFFQKIRNPMQPLRPKFFRGAEFRNRLKQNLIIVTIVEILALLLLHFRVTPAVDFQNYVLDVIMKLSADIGHSSQDSGHPRPTQIFIDVDEKTYRSEKWGKEPDTLPLDRIADLIETAANNGAHHVLVDFVIDGPGDKRATDFVSRMEGILKQYPESHFLFVRTMRQPLELHTARSIRPSPLDDLIEQHIEKVHAVAPNFLRSDDHVLRHWRLWESACRPLPSGQGLPSEGRWVIVPSPQLVISSVAQGLALPSMAEDVACAVDGAESEVLNKAESARMADWVAGRWVFENFGACYQQDSFTTEDCRIASPPARRNASENIQAEDSASRILFRRSDWVRINAAGAHRRTQPNDPNFSRISAGDLLEGAPSGPVSAAFEKFNRRTQLKSNTIAIIGASYEDSRDIHLTPLGEMPGALVLTNAIDTFQTTGILQPPPTLIKMILIVITLFIISVIFAWLSIAWASLLMLGLILLTALPLSIWLLERGIWLDVGAPIMFVYFRRLWKELVDSIDEIREKDKANATA